MKPLSIRRKKEQEFIPLVVASEKGAVQTTVDHVGFFHFGETSLLKELGPYVYVVL